MAIAIERNLVGANTQAGRMLILMRLGDDLHDFLFQPADIRFILTGPVVEFKHRPVMRMARHEKNAGKPQRFLYLLADVVHALTGRRPAQVETDQRDGLRANRENNSPRMQGIAHADAWLITADRIA